MKMIRSIKRRLATVLATSMAFGMLSPAMPVMAASANYGDNVTIHFDPKEGPNLSHSNYSNVPRDNNGISYATGQAGHPLTDSSDFSGIPTENRGSGDRPVLPVFNADLEWPGYIFDGWYNSLGNKITYLPYAFPYSTSTMYEARWIGDTSSQFDFTVMHYRDLNENRNGNMDGTDPNAWPGTGDSQIYEFFNNNGSWTTSVTPNTAVSATYKRNIPGYKIASVLIKNNKVRRYDDASGAGTLGEAATINGATNSVRGNMPNDNLTVAYRYEPDSSKKFALRVEYVDTNGTVIRTPESYAYAAESQVSVASQEITAYTLVSAQITAGDVDDLSGIGIYSAQTAGCTFDGQKNFSGKMPNQPVTVRYTYDIDPDYVTHVTINRIDNHGNMLTEPEIKEVSHTETVTVDVERRDGYIYPPNIEWNGNFTNISMNQDAATLSFDTDATGGTVTITYNEDLNDTTQWARVNYYNSDHGSLSGDSSPRSFRIGTHSIDELIEGITPSPEQHYMFNGWYKANTLGSGKTGEALTGNIELTGDFKLYADFVEDPEQWCDINFESGSHGSISGSMSMHVVKGTQWSQISLPQTTPDNNYMFAGWFDENGNPVTDPNMPILADQTYRARFTSVAGDDGILCIPDGTGSIGNDGMGQIEINGANEARKYALTDREGYLLAVMTGGQLGSGSFENLLPCESYYVYEMAESAAPNVGDILTDSVDLSLISQPARIMVPAIGGNYSTADDTTEGLKKIIISPAAENTVYAVLDMDGNVVSQEGGEDGWLSPSGSPLTAELVGLEPNTFYTVVAKPADNEDEASDRLLTGNQIMVPDVSQQDRVYTFHVINGGYVASVTRNGEALNIEPQADHVQVKEGDRIRIDAEGTNTSGQPFERWEVQIGDLHLSHTAQRYQTVEMPAGDVILQAMYESSPTAPAVNATVDYTPKNGVFALDKSDNVLQNLKEELVDNADDAAALAAGHSIAYTVRFDLRAPVASASNAVRQELNNEEGIKIPWSLDIRLSRKVDGINKPLAEDGNLTPEITVFGKLNTGLLDNLEYKLWKIGFGDSEGDVSCTEVEMTPDPNDEDGGFTGSFSFTAHVGDTLILSYCKAYDVTVIDAVRGNVDTFKVRAGQILEDTAEYLDLDIHEEYIDSNGLAYEFIGLSKNQNGGTLYDVSVPVTKNLKLYAIYEPEDDALWQEAKEKLNDEINIANTLIGNGSVSAEDRDTLTDAVSDAIEVRDRLPRPSIDELETAFDTLKELVDSIRNREPGGSDNPGGPDNPGGSGGSGGSGSGGSGGSGGSSSRSTGTVTNSSINGIYLSKYRTYTVGTDGYWRNLDPVEHTWEFVLNDGNILRDTWANLSYTPPGGETRTYTYHFGKNGIMDTGWFLDQDGNWYYLSQDDDGFYGRLVLGWHYNSYDGKWYYLGRDNGVMRIGWHNISGKWYYFTPSNGGQTWSFNEASNKWIYVGNGERPFGSMYAGETTSDGYQVDSDGAWIQ